VSGTNIKSLVLIRHAKSSWAHPGSQDMDRPLNRRGQNDAPVMGDRLRSRLENSGLKLDAFVCSTATRAAQTAKLLATALAFPVACIDWREELYLASQATMLDTIRTTPDTEPTLALLAHNPGITELAEILSGRAFGNVPTCGIITLQWPVRHWMDVDSPAELIDFDYPCL